MCGSMQCNSLHLSQLACGGHIRGGGSGGNGAVHFCCCGGLGGQHVVTRSDQLSSRRLRPPEAPKSAVSESVGADDCSIGDSRDSLLGRLHASTLQQGACTLPPQLGQHRPVHLELSMGFC